jgi:RNA polymerase sigma-70 factor (ECF subfamily)
MLERTQRATLGQLVRAELPGLFALARQLTGSAPAAEDLVQEALLRACRSFGSLRDVQAGPRWLRVILTNVWRDSLRHRDRTPREVPIDTTEDFSLYRTLADEDPLPYSDTLHVDFVGAFSSEDVHLVLARLPEHLRAPLALRYVAGFSTEEIAELLDLPPGTVYSHLHRGRRAFERALWDYATESGLLAGHPGTGTTEELTR